jgi:hypothetical protein
LNDKIVIKKLSTVNPILFNNVGYHVNDCTCELVLIFVIKYVKVGIFKVIFIYLLLSELLSLPVG